MRNAASTTATTATPAATATPAQAVSAGPTQLSDTDVVTVQAGSGQLVSFGLFKSKDPFVQQLASATPAAATTPSAASAVTPQPVCGPARSCLQTGLYATTTGCFRNGIPLPAEARTLAHHFADACYDTAYIGKWHLADRDPVPPSGRGGYDYWLAANTLEFTSDAYRTVMYDGAGTAIRLPGL